MRVFLKIGPRPWYEKIDEHRPRLVACGHHDGDPNLPENFGDYEYVIVHHEYIRHAHEDPNRAGLRDSLIAADARVVIHEPDPFGRRSPGLPPDWPFLPMETEQFARIVDSIGDLFWGILVD